MSVTTIAQAFAQMLIDSQTQKTALPFIRHQLSVHPIVQHGEEFQSLTIGGSICQSDRMRIDGKAHSLDHKVLDQPSFNTETEFLSYFKSVLDPHVRVVALNFAYPLTPVSRNDVLDGILVSGSKENTFTGLVGKPVGETLELYAKQKLHRTIKVSVANDTICLLLSGLTQFTWSELAAGIVGTGLNFALFLDEHTVVNLESANFNAFEQTPEGKHIDQESVSPGDALFEKEVSGAYLYKHYNLIAQKKNLTPLANTKEIDEKIRSGNVHEKETARTVLKRSAQLVACQIAGILEFQKRDLTFVMQGSLFWKGYEYREAVEKAVQEATQYKATYVQIDNADLLGAAKLVV
ncbi:MAG: hypothetical protein NUV98_03020 [Candidatus Roizmanbacteria bacterium]|nr:hypothetical protein [Candidatus Roizmanbacteria bacterium]